MSIASEITRLQGVKSDILQAIANKGVTVPAGSALDDCPDLIGQIADVGKYIYLSDFSNFDITEKKDYPIVGSPISYPSMFAYNKVMSTTRQDLTQVETLDVSYNIDGGGTGFEFDGLDWSKSKRIKMRCCTKTANGYCQFSIKIGNVIKQFALARFSYGSYTSYFRVAEDQQSVVPYNNTSHIITIYSAKWYTNSLFNIEQWNDCEFVIDVMQKMCTLKCNGIVMMTVGFNQDLANEPLGIEITPNSTKGNNSVNSLAFLSIEDL